MAFRLLAGAMAASLISVLAYRAKALSARGAYAASIVGVCAVAAGWSWGALLVLFFATSVWWSRAGAAFKAARTAGIVEKRGVRDAAQVAANGALFAAATLMLAFGRHGGFPDAIVVAISAGALGALGTATADTWATEAGLLSRAAPRSILSGRAVPAGASGGITRAGTVAGIAGAALIAAGAALAGLGARTALAGFAGGIIGMFVDSILGASVQARRWCDACEAQTECATHACGAPTRHAGGLAWLDNDRVNVLSTAAGAAAAVLALQLHAVFARAPGALA